MPTQALTYVEIDIPAFTQNSPPDSPIPTTTFRFAMDAAYLPLNIDAIPSIVDVSLTPTTVSLGGNLGQRATLEVKFRDHRHVFASEAFTSGTFWGKFRARYGLKLRGYPMRLIQGYVGQALADMETRNFLIESTDGPTYKGEYKIIAKDVLVFASGDRSQAPVLSNGFLVSNITDVASTLTLSPTGIGDAEYPAGTSPPSDYVAIGGKEICAFTRSGDVLTLTRAQFNTVAQAHNAGDRVQLCLHYSGEDVADIIRDLLVTYASVPDAYIPLSAWQAETAGFLGTVYTALIAEPTSVAQLISELIEQAALAVWWDDLEQHINLQVLRQISTEADTYDQDNTLEDTLEVNEQPDARISQVYTYFAKINPLVKDDQLDNYRSSILTSDPTAEVDYGTPAIKKILSRWIPAGGRSVAEILNNKQLGRFRDPPRKFKFHLFRRLTRISMIACSAAVILPSMRTPQTRNAEACTIKNSQTPHGMSLRACFKVSFIFRGPSTSIFSFYPLNFVAGSRLPVATSTVGTSARAATASGTDLVRKRTYRPQPAVAMVTAAPPICMTESTVGITCSVEILPRPARKAPAAMRR